MLKEDCICKGIFTEEHFIYPKGTVLKAFRQPVKVTTKDNYEYVITTSGQGFYGDSSIMIGYLKVIEDIIEKYK